MNADQRAFTASSSHPWLRRYSLLTAAATLCLIGIGGLVTSRGVGMAVPDWPTTYGYNMFLFPFSKWVGGIFYEHSHRLVATFVGLLVVGLTRWLGGRPARLPLAIIGGLEILAGWRLLSLGPSWSGAGYFLSGIGGVVLLAAAVWVRNPPAYRPLPVLGWSAFVLVQLQGLLGGLRVVLFKDQLGIVHAALAQLFFVLLCVIALFTFVPPRMLTPSSLHHSTTPPLRIFPTIVLGTSLLIFLQLLIGATMRHQHAGLAIPDFPLAYGKLWPAMDPASVAHYNQQRLEVLDANAITAFQIALQMVHRILALVIFASVAYCAFLARHTQRPSRANALDKILPLPEGEGRGEGEATVQAAMHTKTETGSAHPSIHPFIHSSALLWLALILAQVLLGAATIWSNKAADIATAHVLIGTLSLAIGALLSIICFRGLLLSESSALPLTGRAIAADASGLRSATAMPHNAFGHQTSSVTGLK